jgi:catechol 2,3-dioxygenase-like lactoylglutathione lyase family enzyme
MIKNIRHTGIIVKDLDSSLTFYRDILGFKIFKRMDEEGTFIDGILGLNKVLVTTIKMIIPDTEYMIELLYYHSHKSKEQIRAVNDIGIGHIAITVTNIDFLYKKLLENNMEFISEPITSDDNMARVVFCRAPEGTYIELVQELYSE